MDPPYQFPNKKRKAEQPTVQGSALLFQQSSTSIANDFLQVIVMKNRAPPNLESGLYQFIDNPNLRSTPANCTGLLVAFSDDKERQDSLKKWRLGVMLYLHPECTVIQTCRFCHETQNFIYSSEKFHSFGIDDNLCVRYLNKISKSTVSEVDKCMKCSPQGPDRVIGYPELSESAKTAIQIAKSTTCSIFEVDASKMPIEFSKTSELERCTVPTFLHLDRGSKKKKRKHLKNLRRKLIKIHKNESKSTQKNGFAFPYIQFNEKVRKFAFLNKKNAKALLSKGKLCVDEYHKMLDSLSFETKEFEVGTMDGVDGIVLEECLGEDEDRLCNDVSIESRTVEPWERDGLVHSTWAIADILNVKRWDLLEHILLRTYGNFGFKRSCTDCFGLNAYGGIRQVEFVRPTPRMPSEDVMKSEYTRQEFDMTYMPLIYKMGNTLSETAVTHQTAVDRLYDRFLLDCHSIDLEKIMNEDKSSRKKLRDILRRSCTTATNDHVTVPLRDQLRRTSCLTILTAMNEYIRGFANKPHLDVGDVCEKDLIIAGQRIIEDVKFHLRDTSIPQKQRKQFEVALNHISKIINLECGQSTFTTCGYNVCLRNSKKSPHVFFLFNDLQTAVQIPQNKGCYHTFGGMFGVHQTAVPVTFDGQYVNMNDNELFVFAWGAGKSDKRVYLEANGVQFDHGERFRQTRMDEFFNNEANDEQRDHIMNMGWV